MISLARPRLPRKLKQKKQQMIYPEQTPNVLYKRAVWTAASVGLCFAVVNATSMLQSQMCMFRWDRPDTWAYTFALTGSPVCRILSQTNSFFHRAAGNVLNIVF
jgi:hypothetical protein